MKAPALYLLTLAALLPCLALADAPQVYKWTDTAGVIHYSDKLPVEPAADAQALDLPPLPPQDPAEIAARQSALLTQLAMLQQLQQSQDIQRQQAAALKQKQAELEAALAALQQPQTQADHLIYAAPVLVPAAYRRNLYVYHRHRDHDDRTPPSLPGRPVKPLKPRP